MRQAQGNTKKSEADAKNARGYRWHPPMSLVGLGKESGELETDASLLLVMTTDPTEKAQREAAERLSNGTYWQEMPGDSPRRALVVAAKTRPGPDGGQWFTFYPACGRFEEGEAPTRKPDTSKPDDDDKHDRAPAQSREGERRAKGGPV